MNCVWAHYINTATIVYNEKVFLLIFAIMEANQCAVIDLVRRKQRWCMTRWSLSREPCNFWIQANPKGSTLDPLIVRARTRGSRDTLCLIYCERYVHTICDQGCTVHIYFRATPSSCQYASVSTSHVDIIICHSNYSCWLVPKNLSKHILYANLRYLQSLI